MNSRKTLVALAMVFISAFLLGASGLPARALAKAPQQPAHSVQQQQSGTDQAVESAFQSAVQQNSAQLLGTLIYQTFVQKITYSSDGAAALLWIGLRDPQTGEVVPGEPGLSIAHNAQNADPTKPASWAITLQSSSDFASQLSALPQDMVSEDVRQGFLKTQAAITTNAAQVFSGYKLPWTAGLAKRVSNSIGHVYSVSGGLASCPTTCRYAFDFYDGTMFPMIAAKGGTVKAVKTTCANNQSSCTNYLILEDQSTIPTSYQVYYHMSNNTVPPRLRTIGAVVQQGEYIGDADNTGYSTGSHLHFHVYTTTTATDWSWGYSVDITFDDVNTNGGRPRTCAEAAAYPNLGSQCNSGNLYTSGNTPAHPPVGTFTSPGDVQVITTRTVSVQGTARDDIQISRIQVLANYDGTWKSIDDITPSTTSEAYAKDVDLCAANIPDGPVALTVRIFDREGSMAPGIPVRQLIKSYACSPTAVPPSGFGLLAPTTPLVPVVPYDIYATAYDADGKPSAQVDFYWHSPDVTQPWQKIGSDTDASDGWSYGVDTKLYPTLPGSQLILLARSKTGGVLPIQLALQPDEVSPVSKLDPLPARINSSVFHLSWAADDPQGDIGHFELQYQQNRNDGKGFTDWQNWAGRPLPGSLSGTWFVGEPGSSYNLRMRAVDQAGHQEAWLSIPEASTTLSKTCTPDTAESTEGQSPSSAMQLPYSDFSPLLNFCQNAQTGPGDVDNAYFVAPKANEEILVLLFPQGGGSAFKVTISDASGRVYGSWQSSDFEEPVAEKFVPPVAGKYYLKIEPLISGSFGTDMRYVVWAGKGNWLVLPIVAR